MLSNARIYIFVCLIASTAFYVRFPPLELIRFSTILFPRPRKLTKKKEENKKELERKVRKK